MQSLWNYAFEAAVKFFSGQNPVGQIVGQMAGDVAKGYGWAFNPVTLFTVGCAVVAWVVVAVRRKLGGKK